MNVKTLLKYAFGNGDGRRIFDMLCHGIASERSYRSGNAHYNWNSISIPGFLD